MANDLTRSQLKLIENAALIAADSPDAMERAYMARHLVQVTLPHRQPKDNPPVWTRTNGKVALTIRPGWDHKHNAPLPYPSGSIPRLLLFWVTTEAIRTKQRKIYLQDSLADFMRDVGLDPSTGGGVRSDAYRLRVQMEALFRATISFDYMEGNRKTGSKGWMDMQVAHKSELWWNMKVPDQPALFGSYVELSESFFEAICASPVPLNRKALSSLKQSPMALDLYAWAAFKTFQVLQTNKPQFVNWEGLSRQMGSDYHDISNFRKKVLASLRKVTICYPGFEWEQVPGGIKIKPGRLAVDKSPKKALPTP